MSKDSFLFLDTPTSQAALTEHLVASYGLTPSDGWLTGPQLSVVVRPWKESERGLSQIGFGPASLTVKFIPRSTDEGFAAQARVLAGILIACPGDASFEFSEGGVELLRRGKVVHIDPDGVSIDDLALNGYRPPHIVVGMPKDMAAQRIEAATMS